MILMPLGPANGGGTLAREAARAVFPITSLWEVKKIKLKCLGNVLRNSHENVLQQQRHVTLYY